MKITDLKITKKGRYALFCDEKFMFSLELESVIDNKLEIGQEIDEEELSELSKQSDYQKAMDKAFNLLSLRPHTKIELIEKLRTKFDEITSETVAERLGELGYINDLEYAEEAIKGLFARKNTSTREALRYLSEKGIDVNDPQIAVLLEEYAPNDVQRIKDILLQKYYPKLATQEGIQKTTAALCRKGFSISDIRTAITEISESAELEVNE